jgi:hypothetical protein
MANGAYSPREYICAEVSARRWSRAVFAERLGSNEAEADALVWSEVEIDKALAARLSKAFGTSATIWLRLEANYRRALKKRQEDCS